MDASEWLKHPHRRQNILTGEWVLVSPHRVQRPWHGSIEDVADDALPAYDPECYLCPGNRRAGDATNPDYTSTFAFDNDFPALLNDVPTDAPNSHRLLVAEAEPGICRVICFSPRHDLTLAEMKVEDIRVIVDLWADEYRILGDRESINHVQIFENKGAAMGCSNPHPHGQIWAQHTVPDEPALELARMHAYFDENGRPLLLDYLQVELESEERVVYVNDSFVVVVPFWAVWPFEVMILPRRQLSSLLEMNDGELTDLADSIRQTTVRYDNLFKTSFPYSAGIHQAPTDGDAHPYGTFHMHFYPPLLRSASVRKFMVGYEMLAGPQRDITAEASARILRNLPPEHYSHGAD